jgi:hypothetical protein
MICTLVLHTAHSVNRGSGTCFGYLLYLELFLEYRIDVSQLLTLVGLALLHCPSGGMELRQPRRLVRLHCFINPISFIRWTVGIRQHPSPVVLFRANYK